MITTTTDTTLKIENDSRRFKYVLKDADCGEQSKRQEQPTAAKRDEAFGNFLRNQTSADDCDDRRKQVPSRGPYGHTDWILRRAQSDRRQHGSISPLGDKN